MGADNETKTTPGTQAFRLLRVRQPRTVALQSWRRVNPRLIIIPQMGELLSRFTLIADKNVAPLTALKRCRVLLEWPWTRAALHDKSLSTRNYDAH